MSDSVSRRSVLRTGATALPPVAGGCLSSVWGEDAAEPTDCDREITPGPTPADTAEFSPKSYPRPPDPLDRSNAAEFVEEFERAYAWNEILRKERDLTYVDVDVRVADVAAADRADAGFTAHATAEFGWGTGGEDETELHADGGTKASYLVTDRRVERFESDDWEFPGATAGEGTVLWCLPETTE